MEHGTQPQQQMLTPRELAAFLRITPQALCNLKRRGCITPAVHVGRIVRYDLRVVMGELGPRRMLENSELGGSQA